MRDSLEPQQMCQKKHNRGDRAAERDGDSRVIANNWK